MSSLEQKIHDIEKELARQYEDARRCYQDNAISRGEWELYEQTHAWFLTKIREITTVQDEVTKQIQEMMVFADLEHTHPSTEFWKGWNKAIHTVLAVLEGAEQK